MSIPYTVRNVFSRGEYLEFNKTITINLINKFKILENYQSLLSDVWMIDYSVYDLTLIVHYDDSLECDGYKLNITTKTKEIEIYGKSDRAIAYAFRCLNALIIKDGETILLPIVSLNDHATFEMRGIIEGFYGEPWSVEARLDMIDTLAEHKMNTYFYAPKDDIYHRDKWRELYPSEELKRLITYKNRCDEQWIDFYYSISPGKDFDYTSESEFNLLYAKLKQVMDLGVNHFSLLLDDIDYKLSEQNKNRFKRPGIAHSYIANKVHDFLKRELMEVHFILCPTEYFQNYHTQYRNDLKDHLDEEITVFWTGYNTVAEVITYQDSEVVKESFGHDLILWENYPVNDFSKERIYLGPIVNRDVNLGDNHLGMVSNPMNQWYASKLSVMTIADYMWNSQKYDPDRSLDLAIRKTVTDEYYDDLKTFIEINSKSVLHVGNERMYKKWVEQKDHESMNAYYEKLSQTVKNLRKALEPHLLNDLELWFKRAEKEAELWVQVSSGKEMTKDKILSVLDLKQELGVNFLVDYLATYCSDIDIDYSQYKKKTRFNYWGI